ncbi:VOC family protein [Embleya sp. NPDC050493]|uniref:VOC family protein n=1 Tax=Embleya sp. NPDC050493 TaxID=3363989 RepID=UPI0037B460F5
MTPLLGTVDQLGYVVTDLRAAMRHWAENLGVGPFFCFAEAAIPNIYYLGERTPVRIGVALAYSGDLQIELIQQLNPEAPSAYADFLQQRGEGLHHLGHFVEEGEAAYDAHVRRFADAGVTPYHNGDSGGPGTRFAYFPTEAHGGTVAEVIETALYRDFFATIRDAARDWDGRDPVRPVGGL